MNIKAKTVTYPYRIEGETHLALMTLAHENKVAGKELDSMQKLIDRAVIEKLRQYGYELE
jgi:hypothetical protein